MTTLLITLPLASSDASTLYDHVLSTDGQTVTGHACAPLALLPQSAEEVVALVPARALSWHLVTLPDGSVPRGFGSERGSARLRSILDGLLEDQLLDEPSQLHLALQPQASSGAPVWVAACDKAWLQGALGALVQAGFAVKRIVPEFTPHMLQGSVVVTGLADAPLVAALCYLPSAAGLQEGAAVDQAAGLLVHALDAAHAGTLQAATQRGIQVLAEPAVASVAEAFFKQPVVLVQHAERLLQALQSPWDMAQFDLANAERARRLALVTQGVKAFLKAPYWRPARWALLLALAVNVIGLNALAFKEQTTLRAKQQAVRGLLTETFPKVPVVVDAPLQMARELAALQRATGASADHDLENLLSVISTVAPEKYALTAIEYAANELRIKGAPLPDPEALAAKLHGLGLQASPQGEQLLIAPGGQR